MPVTSTNMGMLIPIADDPSPDYVTNYYNCLQTLDTHDHTTGLGVQVPVAGININQDLDLTGPAGGGGPFNLANARAVRMVDQTGALTDGGDINETYVINGDLWFNNGTGQNVQVTSGGGLNFSGTGGFGGDYVTAGAQANYDDTDKLYKFFQAGGSTYCDIFAGSYTANTSSPYFEWNPASGTKWRAGDASDNRLVFSADTAATGNTDGNDRYTDMQYGLVLEYATGTNLGLACINSLASAFSLFNATESVGLGWTANFTGSTSAAPYFTGAFVNSSSPSIVGIAGGTSAAGGLSSPFVAGLYLGKDNAAVSGTPDWGVGVMQSTEDFAFMRNVAQTVLYLQKATAFVGVGGRTNPSDACDVLGDVRATGGFKMLVGPFALQASSSGTSGTYVPCTIAEVNAGGTVQTSGTNVRWVAPFAGSIMGMSTAFTVNTGSDVWTGRVYKNGAYLTGAQLISATVAGTLVTAQATFAKDTLTFAAGDYLDFYVNGNAFVGNTYVGTHSIMVEC